MEANANANANADANANANATASPPRKPRQDGLRTRKAIVLEAVSLATVEGLEGLSIGGLARALGIL